MGPAAFLFRENYTRYLDKNDILFSLFRCREKFLYFPLKVQFFLSFLSFPKRGSFFSFSFCKSEVILIHEL